MITTFIELLFLKEYLKSRQNESPSFRTSTGQMSKGKIIASSGNGNMPHNMSMVPPPQPQQTSVINHGNSFLLSPHRASESFLTWQYDNHDQCYQERGNLFATLVYVFSSWIPSPWKALELDKPGCASGF